MKIPYGNGKMPLFFQTAAWDTYLSKLVLAAVFTHNMLSIPEGNLT